MNFFSDKNIIDTIVLRNKIKKSKNNYNKNFINYHICNNCDIIFITKDNSEWRRRYFCINKLISYDKWDFDYCSDCNYESQIKIKYIKNTH